METTFRADRLDAVERAEVGHPWFVARRALLRGVVDRHRPDRAVTVVDVGCGTGRTLREVTRPDDLAVGLDLLAGQAHAGPACGAVLRADVRALPLRDACADVVLCCDVLEHVEDDAAVVAELARVAAPGAVVVVTVPAHPWLWSHRDVDAGHVRRYRAGVVERLLGDAGLTVTQAGGYAVATLPAVAALRVLGRGWGGARDLEERPAGGPLGRALGRLLHAEARRFVAGRRVPTGSSIVVVALRPDGAAA